MTTATSRLRRAGIGGLAALVTVGGSLVAVGAADAATTVTPTRLSGADRYATNLAAVSASFTTAPEVVVAAGTAPYDSLSAAAYAGSVGAPIILVPGNAAVDAAVLAKITSLGATKVTVVGGTGVVNAAAFDSLNTTAHPATRLSGLDRYATSIAIATKVGTTGTFNGKKTIIIASGAGYADALAASAPAYTGKHVLLLTKGTALSAAAVAAITASGATQAIIMGGTGSISDATEAAIKTALGTGGVTTRLGGLNRFETATKLAATLVTATPAGFGFSTTKIVLVNGTDAGFADSITAGPVAGKASAPIVFATAADALPAETTTFLASEKATLTGITVVGGTGVVTDAAVTAAKTAAGNGVATTNQTFTVAGGAKALTVTTDADNKGVQQYTISGLGTAQVNLVLADPANVTTDANAQVSFKVATGATTATLGTGKGEISVINGVGHTGPTAFSVTPVNGQVTFTVNSTVAGGTVPVVFARTDNNNTLSVDAKGVPTEQFGVGVATTYLPIEASAGTTTVDKAITAVDKAAKFIVGGNVYYYGKPGDKYYIAGTDGNTAVAANQVTEAAFASHLSTGDSLGIGTIYNPDFGSTFILLNTAPGLVQTVAATAVSDTSVKVTFAAPTVGAPNSYNVYRSSADTGPAKLSDWIKVGSVAGDATKLELTDTGLSAATKYFYTVTAVTDGDESTLFDKVRFATTLAAGATAALDSTYVAVTTDATFQNELSIGDVWRLVFNQPVVLASNAAIRVQDAQGEIKTVTKGVDGVTFTPNLAPVTIGSTTYVAGRVVTVSFVAGTAGAFVLDNTITGGDGRIQYPATVSNASGFSYTPPGGIASQWVPSSATDKVLNVDTSASAVIYGAAVLTTAVADDSAETVVFTFDQPIAANATLDASQFTYKGTAAAAAVAASVARNADGTVTATFGAGVVTTTDTVKTAAYVQSGTVANRAKNADGTDAAAGSVTATVGA